MPRSRIGKVLIATGAPLFVVAALLDVSLRNAYPWVDPLAEVVVGVAVALLVLGWLTEHLPRRSRGAQVS